MPTLVIENVSTELFQRIRCFADQQKRTPADAALEVLETAFRTVTPEISQAPPISEPFLTPEMSAPFDIPWPKGERVQAVDVPPPLPEPHDLPNLE